MYFLRPSPFCLLSSTCAGDQLLISFFFFLDLLPFYQFKPSYSFRFLNLHDYLRFRCLILTYTFPTLLSILRPLPSLGLFPSYFPPISSITNCTWDLPSCLTQKTTHPLARRYGARSMGEVVSGPATLIWLHWGSANRPTAHRLHPWR